MRQIIIAVLVAIFGPIAILVLERHMTSAPEWIWKSLSLVCIIAGIAIAILSNPFYNRIKNPQSFPISSTLIVSFSVAIIIGGIWWFLLIPSKPASQVQEKQKEIKTLYELFESDFKKTRILGEYILSKKDKPDYTIKYLIFGDFDTKTLFFSMFFPKSNDTFKACMYLIPKYKDILDGKKTLMENMVYHPPGAKAESWGKLIFSGRIYIYHESSLLPERIELLTKEYEKAGLTPQFRGRDYLILKNSPLFEKHK